MKRLLSGIARALASTALVGQEAAPPEFPGGTEVAVPTAAADTGEPIALPGVPVGADDVLKDYRALLERCRMGSHREAVAELRSWPEDRTWGAVDRLLDAWREARIKTAGMIPAARAIQVASLLHADAMLAAFGGAHGALPLRSRG